MLTDSSLAYDSRINVARVAIGSFFPISLANRGEYSLIMITMITRAIMYVGNNN